MLPSRRHFVNREGCLVSPRVRDNLDESSSEAFLDEAIQIVALHLEQFRQFVLPHLTVGRRGPAPKLSLHALFNYILKLLYLGCQWKELPIAKDAERRA